ncbi:amylo-alpha-1,6-glucosidase [Gloeothece verrucosa]|uniref:Glycogen debranching enzyme C-terminal domain-containing protein n=1 Tax=Gloeothece verrucosa (strain PCC 7822) TaxID=497965 RepID=E0ULL6_GLOV7|nr:amylo-alpha-1,6-glucosidase [Gloeothece verrucosa]ADN17846.1 conserved hypothetical protein [Gloeothece verrucosa PCC 7822]
MTSSFNEILSQATAIPSYSLMTKQPQKDRPKEDSIPNPRVISPRVGQPSITTNNIIFDALYALAISEMEENTVLNIRDNNFNNGQAIPCPPGGCFQAGKSWTYVWTRDTAYAIHLALAALKPKTALNSLKFKTSADRHGQNPQIIQDTGTGGSYPISSDRVVWALGAARLLHYLSGEERGTFEKEALEIIKNTIEQDRKVLFDQHNGLYSGEQSFLDWREQTYPGWVAEDVIHVGMSKCLSTNLLHLHILEFGSALALETGEVNLSNQYQDWAKELREAIQNHLYLKDSKLYSTFITTFLDNGPSHQFDLLGLTLAILLEVATQEQTKDIIAHYPLLPNGISVIWPQQQYTPIYHNRAIWPFVTAYWIKAARKAGNATAVNHGIKSLMEGVIRYRSNRENFELVSGDIWVDEGETSGPVVNSQAQLWSIAGYLSMVNDIIFGLETTDYGIRFLPYITCEMRKEVFSETQFLTLNDFPYQGKIITVTVKLPDSDNQVQGAYKISNITLNDQAISSEDFIKSDRLESDNRIVIELSEDLELTISKNQNSITLITDTGEWRNLFAPKYPIIKSIDLVSGKIQITFSSNGENAENIAFNIYRDGKLVKGELPGSTLSWVDPETNQSSPSYCYTVESYYYHDGLAIKNYSQKSRPVCYWGSNDSRIQVFEATQDLNYPGSDQDRVKKSQNHGYSHYENWGQAEDTLILEAFKPKVTGFHLLQVAAANGSGPWNTGVTCGVKYIQVFDQANTCIGSGYLIMPQTSSWENLRDSSFVRVNLDVDKIYKIVIGENENAFNMSKFKHFDSYTGNNGTGGTKGLYNYVNIAALKVLALTSLNT